MEYYKVANSEESARFIRIFDKAFDCLNARSLDADKPCRVGYKGGDDERLKVGETKRFSKSLLEQTFYLSGWKQTS